MSLIPVGSLAVVAGAIVALFGLLWSAVRVGVGKERQAEQLRSATASLTEERKRERLDDEISRDVDLAARARAAGLVRPGGQ